MDPLDFGPDFAREYEIRRPLQAGAEPSVFLAHQRGLDRLVALKFLRPWLVNSAAERDRFLSEARLLAQLKHQHVVEVYDIGVEPRPFMVMEFVDGWNLRQILARRGPLPLRDVFSLMLQISSGLAAIHERGVIHGNLKPENILVDHDGWSKITDLGLASRGPDHAHEDANRAYTPAYMAPELIRGLPGTAQTDVYALGCLLYELLVGTTPFVANDPAEMCRQHLEVPHPPVRGLTRTIPIELENIVRTALAKPTGRRYPDVNSMRLDLEDLALFAQLWIDDYVPSANPTEPEKFPAWAVTLPVRPLTPADGFPPPVPRKTQREIPNIAPRPILDVTPSEEGPRVLEKLPEPAAPPPAPAPAPEPAPAQPQPPPPASSLQPPVITSRPTGPVMVPPVYMPPAPQLEPVAVPTEPTEPQRQSPPPLALLAGLSLLLLTGHRMLSIDPTPPPLTSAPAPALEIAPIAGGVRVAWKTSAPCSTRLWYQTPARPQLELADASAPSRAHALVLPAAALAPGTRVWVDLGGRQRSAPAPLAANAPALAISAARLTGAGVRVETTVPTDLSLTLLATGALPEESVRAPAGLRTVHEAAVTAAPGRILRVTARDAGGDEVWTALQIERIGPEETTLAQDQVLADRFVSDGSLLVQWNADRTWASELNSARTLWSVDFAPAYPARPLLRREAVLVPGGDGRVRRLERLTGRATWTVEVARARPVGGLASDADQVFACTSDGMVVAMDLARGGVHWATQAGPGLAAGPVIQTPVPPATSGTVWVAGSKGGLFGMNADTGEVTAELPLAMPAIQLAGVGSRRLIAASATEITLFEDGQKLWSTPGTGTLAADDAGLAAATTGLLVMLDPATGRELKRVTATPVEGAKGAALALGAHAAYVALGDGAVRAVDRASGKTLWSVPMPGGVQELARARGQLLALDAEAHLHLIREP